MIKAVLKYSYSDEQIINYYFAKSKIIIIKTDGTFVLKVTIVGSMEEIKEMVALLNSVTSFPVSVVKARRTITLFGFYI